MHIYTICPSLLQSFRKFCWAVSEELRWPTVSVVSFIFFKFRSSKRALFKEKKWNYNFLWICTSTYYVLHYYKVSGNSVEWFQRSCANKKYSSIFHFGQISKFLHYYKVSGKSVEWFQRSCTNKKNRTDWLTDWLTDGRVKNIIPSATRCMGYKNIMVFQPSISTFFKILWQKYSWTYNK